MSVEKKTLEKNHVDENAVDKKYVDENAIVIFVLYRAVEGWAKKARHYL